MTVMPSPITVSATNDDTGATTDDNGASTDDSGATTDDICITCIVSSIDDTHLLYKQLRIINVLCWN